MITEFQNESPVGAKRAQMRAVARSSDDKGWEIGSNERLNAICPYFTMFPLEFPLRILEREKRNNVAVIDPFCGRGTTLYAARLRNLTAFGIDSSPTAIAISEAKLVNTSPGAIMRTYDEIMEETPLARSPHGDFWELAFHAETLRALSKLRKGLLKDCQTGARRALRALVMGALHGALTKGAPSYFSNQMPRTFSPKPDYAVRFWRSRKLVPPKVEVRALIERRAYRFYGAKVHMARGRTVLGDSRGVTTARDAVQGTKIDWVITSPPYYGMKTYLPDQWLRLWFVGGRAKPDYSVEGQVSHLNPKEFAGDLGVVWKNLEAVCKDGATMVVRFGSINDRDADPITIIKSSLEKTSWTISTIRPAGSAADGRRQANHFSDQSTSAPPEYDVWARLTGG